MMEILERSEGVDETEIFRTRSVGGLQVRYTGTPYAQIQVTESGTAVFDPKDLKRLGEYLVRYAERLGKLHPAFAPARQEVAWKGFTHAIDKLKAKEQ